MLYVEAVVQELLGHSTIAITLDTYSHVLPGMGDAAADFSCMIFNYGEGFLAKMAKSYPEIETAIDRARFWAGTLPLQWALSGYRTKNYWWNLVHIGGARDAMPIGAKFLI